MNNFILLDGLTLYVFLGLILMMFLSGLVLAVQCMRKDKQLEALEKEKKRLVGELSAKGHELTVAQTTIGFLRRYVGELEEETV